MPPKAPKNPNNELDKAIKELFKLMLYAHSEDMRNQSIMAGIEDSFENTGKLMHEHLDNILAKKEAKKKLASRFTITPTVVQMLRFIALGYITEVNQIDIRVNDMPETIIDKIDECGIMNSIAQIIVSQNVVFTAKLANITGQNKLQQILVEKLNQTRYGANAQASGKVIDYYINFMRSLAQIISAYCWMDPNNKLDKLWTGALYNLGVPLERVMEYRAEVVIPPKKPKKPKSPGPAAPVEQKPGEQKVEPAASEF